MPFLTLALLAGTLAANLPPSPPPAGRPVRLSGMVFGQPIEVEIRDLPEETARQAIHEALIEATAIERLADPDGDAAVPGSLAALNAGAVRGPQPVDPRLLPGLARALDFCFWSEKAYGPLARDLNRLWGVRAPVGVSPAQRPEILDLAVAATQCERLRLDLQKRTAALANGSGVDLWGFAEGLAIDRVVEVLRAKGARNGYVHTGSVYRGFGPGPDGRGWSVVPPLFTGMTIPLGRIFLRDRALAVIAAADLPLQIGDATFSPWVSQRTGLPVQGAVVTLVVADHALDAQGLAVTMTVTGPGEGQLRLGSLRPKPSVLWLQGTGAGDPLQIDYNWSEVPKR